MQYIILTFTLLFSLSFINAQETATTANNGFEAQFNQIIKEAGNYQDYKVVKLVKLNQLKDATVKKINDLNSNIDQLENNITGLESKIENLSAQLNATQEKVNDLKNAKDSISLFGISLDKFTYNLILWSIMAGLLLFMVIFIFKFKNANEVTRAAKSNLSLVENELESYKRRSMEKEQHLSRQLMDERKKNAGKS